MKVSAEISGDTLVKSWQ